MAPRPLLEQYVDLHAHREFQLPAASRGLASRRCVWAPTPNRVGMIRDTRRLGRHDRLDHHLTPEEKREKGKEELERKVLIRQALA